ncbi:uncharacterized protein LOC119388913 [Rhipicephalus sanguineus]|uniref:uncharacterized protein LOC119388913 n=1 Tax=Rhipicephalus sanguineus TaxID=34632 RepID=UPI0018956FCC|nr:uncharacterized protein LOC119388913 [Rhipicephalus sanguineus]
MGSSATSLLFVAALLVVQSVFVGSLFLPFGGIASAANGIIGFKISMAGSLLSMLSQAFTGTFNLRAGTDFVDSPSEELSGRSGLLGPDGMTTTTEKTEIKVPVSALQNVLNVDDERKRQLDLLFTFLKEIDDRGCVSRMVCESVADAIRFGKVGNATKNFFSTNVGVDTGAASVFVDAAKTGRSRGIAGCAQAFPECNANLPHILTAAGLM